MYYLCLQCYFVGGKVELDSVVSCLTELF